MPCVNRFSVIPPICIISAFSQTPIVRILRHYPDREGGLYETKYAEPSFTVGLLPHEHFALQKRFFDSFNLSVIEQCQTNQIPNRRPA